MKRFKVLSFGLLLFGLMPAFAQTKKPQAKKPEVPTRTLRAKLGATTHSVQLTWTNATAATVIIINRAPCVGTFTPAAGTPNVGTCSQDGTFSQLGTTALNATSFTDATVAAATVYDYNVQATFTGSGGVVGALCSTFTLTGCTSVQSNSVAALIPPTAPLPPVLNLGPVATNLTGAGTVAVSLTWTSPYSSTVYTLFNENGIMRSLRTQSVSRSYSMLWNGTAAAIYKARIVVCDIDGCQTQAIPSA
jgi:hypothetical protein